MSAYLVNGARSLFILIVSRLPAIARAGYEFAQGATLEVFNIIQNC